MNDLLEDLKGFIGDFEGVKDDAVKFVYESARRAIRKSSGIKPKGLSYNEECIQVGVWGDFDDDEDTTIFIEDGGISEKVQVEILEYIIDYLVGKKRLGRGRALNATGSFVIDKKKRKIIWQGADSSYCREMVRRMNNLRLEWMGWDLVFCLEN